MANRLSNAELGQVVTSLGHVVGQLRRQCEVMALQLADHRTVLHVLLAERQEAMGGTPTSELESLLAKPMRAGSEQ